MVNVCDRALPTTSHRQPSRRLDTQSTSAQFNSLNQITSTTPAAQMHVVGHTDEPAQVTVNGQDATTYPDNSYSAWVPAAPGDNTITVEATDFSPNANTATKSWSVQLAGESPRSFTYDANGNTLSDGLRTYQWDANNRLVKITQDGDEYEFLYDAFDRRVAEKINGTVVRRFVWDGLALAEQRAADGVTVQKRYYPQGEERIGGSDAGKHFYFRDHLGSVREMTDASGTVRARFAYDFYGSRTQIEGDLSCEIGFTGHPVHEPTQLVLAPFRAYDPATARWLSRDPIQESGGINLYQYVANNPVNITDPLGLWGVQFGMDGRNIGVGNPTLVFTSDSWGDLGRGAAATADGFIPFADPFQEHYDPCDLDTAISKALGEFSRNTLLTAAGLRAGAALGGTRLGHGLNHNPYLRIGPGRMPARGGLPAGPKVPRMSIGRGPGNPHIDLRIRPFD